MNHRLELTPAAIAESMRGGGFKAGVGGEPDRDLRGWRVTWAGERAVRVEHPLANPGEYHTAAEVLRQAGWHVEPRELGWLRVTRNPP